MILCRNQEFARLDKEISPDIRQSLNQHLSFLDQQIEKIEDSIKILSNETPEIKNKIDRLTSISGVGITLATTVVCEAPEFGFYRI